MNQGDGIKLNDRRRTILDLLERDGKVQVAQLSGLLGASEVTIRSDLNELEREGFLERMHGGAVPARRSYYNMTHNERSLENTEDKLKIAALAAAMVKDGETLIFGSGTTTLYTALELKRQKNIKIVTNSIGIAQAVGNYDNISVILLGGDVNAAYSFTYGSMVVSQLMRYKANRAILSVDGITAENGLSTYHYEESSITQLIIERANQTIIVADRTKVGRDSFLNFASIDKIDQLVTNDNASQSELIQIEKAGVEVIKA